MGGNTAPGGIDTRQPAMASAISHDEVALPGPAGTVRAASKPGQSPRP